MVLPAYDYSGLAEDKPPRLMAIPSTDSLVLPDLLSARDGASLWVEVKYKWEATFTHITGRMETGINLRLWNHYLQVEKVTGCRVWVLFAHEWEGEIRVGSLSGLRVFARQYKGRKMGQDGMVFFPYYQIPKIADFWEVIPEA